MRRAAPCTGDLSRNRHVGQELGRGRGLGDVLGEMRQVAEGVRAARSAWALSQREGVPMPIVGEVYAVLYEGKATRDAVRDLMVREAHLEFERAPRAAWAVAAFARARDGSRLHASP